MSAIPGYYLARHRERVMFMKNRLFLYGTPALVAAGWYLLLLFGPLKTTFDWGGWPQVLLVLAGVPLAVGAWIIVLAVPRWKAWGPERGSANTDASGLPGFPEDDSASTAAPPPLPVAALAGTPARTPNGHRRPGQLFVTVLPPRSAREEYAKAYSSSRLVANYVSTHGRIPIADETGRHRRLE